MQEFSTAVDFYNVEFKQNVVRQAQNLKIKDQSELNKAVDEIKI